MRARELMPRPAGRCGTFLETPDIENSSDSWEPEQKKGTGMVQPEARAQLLTAGECSAVEPHGQVHRGTRNELKLHDLGVARAIAALFKRELAQALPSLSDLYFFLVLPVGLPL